MGWVPDSLYNMAVSAIVTSYSRYRREIKSLPERVQFDIYYKVEKTRHKTMHSTDSSILQGFRHY